jgi:hypothetical protein
MRNIQIIDGADNASYSVYAVSDGDFSVLFPAGTDIDFAGDLTTRIGLPEAGRILSPLWGNELDQAKICGIHGTIIYELLEKILYFPTRRSTELEHRHSNAYRWLDVKEAAVWHEAHLNVQVFDERAESDYPVFAATRSEFELIFPSGADMEFENDLLRRLGSQRGYEILHRVFGRRIAKSSATGIHGALFRGHERRKSIYPTKRRSEEIP